MRLALLSAVALACATFPLTPQRKQQGISHDLEMCLRGRLAQETPSIARECDCDARRACLAAGLPKGCAWDDWVMHTNGHYPLIVGYCEESP